MDDSFFQAFFPPSVRVCGANLRPFSIWHQMCLMAIDSPLLGEDEEFTPSDLLLAVRICQTAWPVRPDLRPRLIDIYRRWRLERNPELFQRAAVLFVGYMVEFNTRPRFWQDEQDEGGYRELTGPPILSQVAGLVSDGHSLSDAWNMSPGEAGWYESVMAERRGSEARFLWEEDLLDDLPDLREVDEETLMRQAIEDLGLESAREWMALRKANQVTS